MLNQWTGHMGVEMTIRDIFNDNDKLVSAFFEKIDEAVAKIDHKDDDMWEAKYDKLEELYND